MLVKFDQNPISTLEENLVWRILLTDARTTDKMLSQKLTLSVCDRRAKIIIIIKNISICCLQFFLPRVHSENGSAQKDKNFLSWGSKFFTSRKETSSERNSTLRLWHFSGSCTYIFVLLPPLRILLHKNKGFLMSRTLCKYSFGTYPGRENVLMRGLISAFDVRLQNN